ncbi:DUF1857-domain-containing protein [Periconia macrospinosa]|uniref:DUF1857-domain-containing protein n=1 Tax=Periconia macrospinosa TaxID=97972 RepID=A0A2V1EER8_9PLEO|nr:DUF1857-domain-containing protein [Periconia macrospinosa]
MTLIALAFTAPLNPPSTPASERLTRAQLQAGLHRKVRFPQEFIPAIEACEVLSDKDNVVERHAIFKPGYHKKDTIEKVRTWGDVWHDFENDDGTVIRNIVSEDTKGDGEIYVTFTFEFRIPNLKEDTPEYEEQKKKLEAMGRSGVDGTIQTIRTMVKDGRIKV